MKYEKNNDFLGISLFIPIKIMKLYVVLAINSIRS